MYPARFAITSFGTSIMEHYEAPSSRPDLPYDPPEIGEAVVIDSYRRRRRVHLLFLRLQAADPDTRLVFDNRDVGGARSRGGEP